MPSAHRIALKKLLEATVQKIAEAESRMVKAASDEERAKLIETLADLHVSQNEVKAALLGDDR